MFSLSKKYLAVCGLMASFAISQPAHAAVTGGINTAKFVPATGATVFVKAGTSMTNPTAVQVSAEGILTTTDGRYQLTWDTYSNGPNGGDCYKRDQFVMEPNTVYDYKGSTGYTYTGSAMLGQHTVYAQVSYMRLTAPTNFDTVLLDTKSSNYTLALAP